MSAPLVISDVVLNYPSAPSALQMEGRGFTYRTSDGTWWKHNPTKTDGKFVKRIALEWITHNVRKYR